MLSSEELRDIYFQQYVTSGNDIINGTNETEIIFGGAGNDSLTGENGNDTIIGGLGNDTLFARYGDDTFSYTIGDGNDVITDRAILAISGYINTLFFTGDLTLEDIRFSRPTTGSVETNSKGFIISFVDEAGSITIPTQFDGSSNSLYYAVHQLSFESGGVISAGDLKTLYLQQQKTDGNDTILGFYEQAASLEGGAGNDSITGSTYNDTLVGGTGKNTLTGGAGADTFQFLTMQDSTAVNGQVTTIMDFTVGMDKIDLSGLNYFYSLKTTSGSTKAGELRISYSSTTNRTYLRSDQEEMEIVLANGDYRTTLSQADFIFGKDDTVLGTDLADTLIGGTGDDILFGEGGNDIAYGAAGNDSLLGGLGNDTLIGGVGADTLDGGAGINTASYADATSQVRLDLLGANPNVGDAVGDVIINIAHLTGSVYGDYLRGDNSINSLRGDAGNDYLYGRDGNDTLTGGDGNDVLYGQNNDDTLSGDAGNDTLDGGDGRDRLSGGIGADVFRFAKVTDSTRSNSEWDAITDFEIGIDKIDLRSLGFASFDDNANTTTEVASELLITYSASTNRTYLTNDQQDFRFYLEGNMVGVITEADMMFI